MTSGNGREPYLPTPDEIDRMINPTGGKHTPLPWKADDAPDGKYYIADQFGVVIGSFHRKEDRDSALFWANTHRGVIVLLRGFQRAFEFVALTEDSGTKHFCETQAEIAEIWTEFFTTLGASARKPE